MYTITLPYFHLDCDFNIMFKVDVLIMEISPNLCLLVQGISLLSACLSYFAVIAGIGLD